MQNTTISHNNNNWLLKTLEDIGTITKIIYQFEVTDTYLLDPAKQVEVKYMSAFVKQIDIPSILENPNIAQTLDPLIVELYYWTDTDPLNHNVKRIEQLLHDSKADTSKILYK